MHGAACERIGPPSGLRGKTRLVMNHDEEPHANSDALDESQWVGRPLGPRGLFLGCCFCLFVLRLKRVGEALTLRRGV